MQCSAAGPARLLRSCKNGATLSGYKREALCGTPQETAEGSSPLFAANSASGRARAYQHHVGGAQDACVHLARQDVLLQDCRAPAPRTCTVRPVRQSVVHP